MRFITWNCCVGGFRNKAKYVAELRPDALAVQEVTHRDEVLIFPDDPQPTFARRAASRPNARGIGLYSYTDTKLAQLDVLDSNYGFIRHEARCGELEFQVVAVWTYPAEPRTRNYRQVIEGIETHADWIREHPTVIMGDFNDNGSFRKTSIPELLDLLRPLGLVSAYHTKYAEGFGQETRPTHYYKKRQDAPFHLDYVFLPASWAQRITTVEVGTYEDWHRMSDHVPVIVDVDLQA